MKINPLKRKVFTNLVHSNMTPFSPDHKGSTSKGLWENEKQRGKFLA